MTDKLELKSSHEVVYTVYVADVDSIFQGKPTDPDILTVVMKGGRRLYCDEVCPVDSLQEEPVSEELKEEVIKKVLYFSENFHKAPWAIDSTGAVMSIWYAKFGAKWQKEQIMASIWKPADGDRLPDIDKEVIALLDNGKVVFAHRPSEYWDGKNIITGKVTRYYPKTYGKGGWNIPNVILWLDLDIPKL